MYKKTVVCKNPFGIHNRPSVYISKLAKKFKSQIRITAREKTVDPKGAISLTSLNIVKDTKVTVLAVGPDERETVDTITEFIVSDIDVEQRYRNAFKKEESKCSSQ